jgi:hemerythrin-like metal-binding protein
LDSKWKERYPYSDQVYKALPFVYLCAGLLTIAVVRNVMAVFSGLILIAAAGLVWLLRYQYRRAFNESKGRIELPVLPVETSPLDGLTQISWRKEFECGHPVIDAQHRHLFGISNELIHAAMSDMSKVTLEVLLDELIDHFNEHIAAEEAILARLNHPISEEHQEHHATLSAKAAALREQFHDTKAGAVELIAFLAYDIISNHVLTEELDLG